MKYDSDVTSLKQVIPMDFNELVRRRYSSRAYKPDPVEDDKVRSILEAGRLAPTARNDQPVRVIAVRSKEGLAKIEEAGHIYDAPLAFIVYADSDRTWTRSYDGMKTTDIDASIVTTQMMYEATDMGLGTLWVCMFKPDVIRRNFGLDDNMIPVNILAVGYKDDTTSRNHGVRIPMDEFVRFA